MIRSFVLFSFTLLATAIAFAEADGKWLEKVPSRDHAKTSPYVGQADAVAAGSRLFADHCSKCHGTNAEGRKKHPSLRTERVQSQASEGDIHWLLVNGNMRKGMPSWARLPDPQLWQIVSYLKTLKE